MPRKTKTTKKSRALYRLNLPAHSENLHVIRKFVSEIASNLGFDEEAMYQIELAVDEACTNVIKHAYRNDQQSEKIIKITLKVKEDRLIIIVADKGCGFNPAAIKSPDMEKYIKKGKRGGLGLHLIKSLMDEVSFRMKPGVRNEVIMVKKRKG
ncbi:MAG: ATP-binding protein [Calditrichaeota bacterium]|nr:MAG: ATP-binding protein [Calditrichota bacterium]